MIVPYTTRIQRLFRDLWKFDGTKYWISEAYDVLKEEIGFLRSGIRQADFTSAKELYHLTRWAIESLEEREDGVDHEAGLAAAVGELVIMLEEAVTKTSMRKELKKCFGAIIEDLRARIVPLCTKGGVSRL